MGLIGEGLKHRSSNMLVLGLSNMDFNPGTVKNFRDFVAGTYILQGAVLDFVSGRTKQGDFPRRDSR